MKKLAIWAFAALAMFAVSCDKNNTNPGEDSSTPSLVGTWSISSGDFSATFVFSSDKLTAIIDADKVEGSYTVENSIIAFNIEKKWERTITYGEDDNPIYGEWVETELSPEDKEIFYLQAKLIYDGAVLILDLPVEQNLPKSEEGEEDQGSMAIFLFKEGKTIPSDTKPLQGEWNWYWVYPTETHICVRIIFEGNNFEIIITPFAAKVTGSYTYKDGWINCNISAGYIADNAEINPVTLEATWIPVNIEEPPFSEGLSFPFVADGKDAYAIMEGVSFKLEKK